jgi:hypothetical protein
VQIPDHGGIKVMASAVMNVALKMPHVLSQATVERVAKKLTAAEAGINDMEIVAKFRQHYAEELQINEEYAMLR